MGSGHVMKVRGGETAQATLHKGDAEEGMLKLCLRFKHSREAGQRRESGARLLAPGIRHSALAEEPRPSVQRGGLRGDRWASLRRACVSQLTCGA
jgi:hypothetical protein